MLTARMRTNELLDVIERHQMWSVMTTTYKLSHKLVERHRSLIRCEYCGMSYDGNDYDNCPHCLAPRPRTSTGHAVETSESAVMYSDDLPYYPAQCGILTNNELRATVPEPYGTVERR